MSPGHPSQSHGSPEPQPPLPLWIPPLPQAQLCNCCCYYPFWCLPIPRACSGCSGCPRPREEIHLGEDDPLGEEDLPSEEDIPEEEDHLEKRPTWIEDGPRRREFQLEDLPTIEAPRDTEDLQNNAHRDEKVKWSLCLGKPRLQEVGASATLNPSPGRDYSGEEEEPVSDSDFSQPPGAPLPLAPLPSSELDEETIKGTRREVSRKRQKRKGEVGEEKQIGMWRAKYEETGEEGRGLVPEGRAGRVCRNCPYLQSTDEESET